MRDGESRRELPEETLKLNKCLSSGVTERGLDNKYSE